MDFVEEADWLVFGGIVEGEDVLTLHNLLRAHLGGLINAEEMLREINSFKSGFYQKLMQNQSYEC